MKAQDVIKEYTEYKRECNHTEMCHWKKCAECREFLVRKDIEHSHSSLTQAISEDLVEMKFPSIEDKSKEFPSTEYPTAKPAHESNEIFMQHAHNQALSQVQEYLKKLTINK